MIETDSNDTTAPAALANGSGGGASSGPPAKVLPCTLDTATTELVELIFRWVTFRTVLRRTLHCKVDVAEGWVDVHALRLRCYKQEGKSKSRLLLYLR